MHLTGSLQANFLIYCPHVTVQCTWTIVSWNMFLLVNYKLQSRPMKGRVIYSPSIFSSFNSMWPLYSQIKRNVKKNVYTCTNYINYWLFLRTVFGFWSVCIYCNFKIYFLHKQTRSTKDSSFLNLSSPHKEFTPCSFKNVSSVQIKVKSLSRRLSH